MTQNSAFYNAYVSRDPRFDGVFFIGVTSTGIYCRPICPAKTPKPANCRFFASAETAEKAAFRPCLRCRPELAPGSAPVDDAARIAGLIVSRIEEGLMEDEAGLEDIASQFELSSRQIRRILQKELGVSPIELILTRRLLLAKQLLTETRLPVTEIAFASGFSSLRRFNDAFSRRYRMPPTRLRNESATGWGEKPSPDTLELQLTYRPPYDWPGLLAFMAARALKGVEWIEENSYARTIELAGCKGWIHLHHTPENRALKVRISQSLLPVLPALLGRLRHVFDLNARPDLIARQLGQDGLLAEAVARNPGLRVPGAFDGFELAVRAILGQQITVKAATTLAGRFVDAFGEKITTPFSALERLSPTPERIARASVDDIASLGIIAARARCIIALAQEFTSGRLKLDAGTAPEAAIKQLVGLPGIGQWTAHYIAMRALRWPDAFPKEDIAIRKNLGGVTPRQAEEMSQPWRPWRSYAVLHIWENPIRPKEKIPPSQG